MNKNRVETISDGVFSIVMTLLIFNVSVAAVATPITDRELWVMIGTLWPLLVSYALSFLVLSVFWINHHFTFHRRAKNVNRQLNLMNMLYLMLLAGMLYFDGAPHLWPLPPMTVVWLAYNGLIGMGLIYFVWFVVVDKLPTMTASIGSLLVPVVGVIGSTAINGERPDLYDIAGFALIFTAAATVLLQPNTHHDELPE